jgi:hypothetical protein
MPSWIFLAFVLAAIIPPMSGCGGAQNSLDSQSAPDTPVIVTQPQDATVPMSQSATFSVYAVGAVQLSYQWSKNGSAIQGATGSSYTTPAVAFADTGSTFSVTVSNGPSSSTSRAAVLTVGARSPAAGDLRFQEVDSPATANGFAGEGSLYLWYPSQLTYQNTFGLPLRMGSGICVPGVAHDCAWFYIFLPTPPGVVLSTRYLADLQENLGTDLSSYIDASSVVTSLDIEAGNDVFAMAWMKGSATGFDYKHEVASMSGLQALVATDGANSRVVTAISFDGTGQVHFLSYGWGSDTKTVYDTSVAVASFDEIPAQAMSLANAGYIITAFGGDPTYGYVMVGTKVHGDSLPRPILTFPPAPSGTSINSYALVALAEDVGDGNDSVVWVYEK